MIDEARLDGLVSYIKECDKFGNYPQLHPGDLLELIHGYRLGLIAEKSLIPALKLSERIVEMYDNTDENGVVKRGYESDELKEIRSAIATLPKEKT